MQNSTSTLAAIVTRLAAQPYNGPSVLPPARVKRHPLRDTLRRAARLRTIERALYGALAAAMLLTIGGAIEYHEQASARPACVMPLSR